MQNDKNQNVKIYTDKNGNLGVMETTGHSIGLNIKLTAEIQFGLHTMDEHVGSE